MTSKRSAAIWAWRRSAISPWTACAPRSVALPGVSATPASRAITQPPSPTPTRQRASRLWPTIQPICEQLTMSDVYFFANGKADGSAELRDILGGKGANLAEMTNLGIPVPPGFTLSARLCIAYIKQGQLPGGLEAEVRAAVERLQEVTGRRFGDLDSPLLVSVRSGAKFSMPGMMDTILNLGLNDETVAGLARSSGNPRFAYDSYRRLIQMYGDVVFGIKGTDGHSDPFDTALATLKKQRGVVRDVDL